MAMGFIIFGER